MHVLIDALAVVDKGHAPSGADEEVVVHAGVAQVVHCSSNDNAELLHVAQGPPSTCHVGLQCLQDDTCSLGDICGVGVVVVGVGLYVVIFDLSEVLRNNDGIQEPPVLREADTSAG